MKTQTMPNSLPETLIQKETALKKMLLGNQLGDKFFYDTSKVPTGMEYEWKRVSILGQEDRAYQAETRRAYWKPVPASRHPEVNAEGDTIIIGGQMLMEREKHLNQFSREVFVKQANNDRREQFERLKLSDHSAFPREAPKLQRSYEAVQPIPA